MIARKTIKLTREDIWEGRPHDAHACPIAKCLNRLFPGRRVSVFYDYCLIDCYYAPMPEIATKFAESIDMRPAWARFFKRPISFSLEFRKRIDPTFEDCADGYGCYNDLEEAHR